MGTELQQQFLRSGKAGQLAQYLGWPEANYRDAGKCAMERVIREGYAWNEQSQEWQKVGTLVGETQKL